MPDTAAAIICAILPSMKKTLFLSLLLVLLIGGGIFLFAGKNSPSAPAEEQAGTTESDEQTEPAIARAPFPEEYLDDQDRDGIPNDQEEKLNTSATDTDTDGDGLTDADELSKWGTDPTKLDSDQDGFGDLSEILAGYNPAGPGKLSQ